MLLTNVCLKLSPPVFRLHTDVPIWYLDRLTVTVAMPSVTHFAKLGDI